jgi:DNA modification methylase
MENLLHYHTEPLDIVFDPFGGGGTTIDVCKRMFRRYYVSDRKTVPGRENEIREHDIKDGLPTDLQKPALVFLDPPYWKQAENKYSNDPTDLANMSLDDFNNSMEKLFKDIAKRKIQKIALVISPTQWPNKDKRFIHHTRDFDRMLKPLGYEIEMEYILPYSSEQYNGTQVNIAKEKNICLSVARYLTVWDFRKG